MVTRTAYSADGPWESSRQHYLLERRQRRPGGQGDGKYGAIGSWNVGGLSGMRSVLLSIRVLSSSCLLRLSLSFISDPTHSHSSLLLLLLSLSLSSPSSVF